MKSNSGLSLLTGKQNDFSWNISYLGSQPWTGKHFLTEIHRKWLHAPC